MYKYSYNLDNPVVSVVRIYYISYLQIFKKQALSIYSIYSNLIDMLIHIYIYYSICIYIYIYTH